MSFYRKLSRRTASRFTFNIFLIRILNTLIMIFMNTIIILTKTNFMANFDQGWKQGRTWQVEREASNEIQHLFLQKVKMVIT